jgi:hypothetical protein
MLFSHMHIDKFLLAGNTVVRYFHYRKLCTKLHKGLNPFMVTQECTAYGLDPNLSYRLFHLSPPTHSKSYSSIYTMKLGIQEIIFLFFFGIASLRENTTCSGV